MQYNKVSFSPYNIYANDYYNARNEFNKIQSKVIKYEQQTNDRESPEYKKMMAEFSYWDHKVPELSKLAENEEKELNFAHEQKNKQNPFGSPFHIDGQLNYFA